MVREIEFRPATQADAVYIADHLRRDDCLEAEATGVKNLRFAVELSRSCSDFAWVALSDGVPALIFGVSVPLMGTEGEIWALGTDVCTASPREMLFYGRKKIRELLELCPEYGNYCDARYDAAHRWLKKLGFQVSPPEPRGPRGKLFCKIYIRREQN